MYSVQRVVRDDAEATRSLNDALLFSYQDYLKWRWFFAPTFFIDVAEVLRSIPLRY